MATVGPLILVALIATCAAFNPVRLSGSVVDQVAREQLSNVVTLKGPAPSSNGHRSTRSASASHAVNSTVFALTGDRHQYGEVFYSGAGSSVVFALMFELQYDSSTCVLYSPSSTLWRSEDYGTSFQKANIADNKMSRIFFQNPTKPKEFLFTDEQDDILYITTDEGRTFNAVQVPIDPQTIKYHPTATNVAMAFQTGGSQCGDVHGTLYMTLDGGQTWQERKKAVKTYFWEDAAHELQPSERGNNPQNMTFYYMLESETQHRIYRSSVLPGFSGDADIEFDPALGEVDSFLLLDRFIFAQTTAGDSNALYVSSQRKPFKLAKIPNPYRHNGYFVDLVRDSQALVIVQHIDDTSPSGVMHNLYLSDSEGASYSLALPDLAYFDTGLSFFFDLEYIAGLPGTYIANQYLSGHSGDGNNVRTLISFDGGAEWDFVTPPSDVLSSGILCEPPLCSLHFHMTASANYSRLGIASWDSIPGIIIAHGTAGSKLADKPDLYISRDGGITWQLTLDKAWGVGLMDYGGVIVAAKDYTQEASHIVKYTCQEGLPGQWQDHTFVKEDIYVWGVITEPGENSVMSLLFGTEAGQSNWEWKVAKLDFQQTFTGKCDIDDYFIWEPWNARVESEQNCLFGETLAVERRKVNVCCYNGGDYTRVKSTQPCACIPDDYECDWGYKRESGTDGPCVRDPDVTMDPANCNGTHLVLTKGYRKIAGDHCIGGDTAELEPTVVTCTSGDASSNTSTPSSMEVILVVIFTVLFLLLVFMIVMLSVMVVYMFKRYRRMRQTYRVLLGGQPQFEASSPQANEGSGGEARLQFNNDEVRDQFATDDEPLIDP